MESLHSKSINGVLQELYASFILNNMLRLEAHENGGFEVSPDTPITKKVNFKFLVEMSFDWLEKIWFEKIEEFVNLMKNLVTKNISKRKRMSRWYEREIKGCRKSYKNSALVVRRV